MRHIILFVFVFIETVFRDAFEYYYVTHVIDYFIGKFSLWYVCVLMSINMIEAKENAITNTV